jgi:aminopeptidase N
MAFPGSIAVWQVSAMRGGAEETRTGREGCMSSPLRLSVFFTLLLPFILSVDSGQGAEIVHHDIEARIDPRQRSITVTDVLTVARARSSTLEPFGFFLNRHLKLSEVSAIDGEWPWTIEAIPSRDALRAYFPAVDPAQTPSYTIATYYRLIPAGQGSPGDGPLRLRLVYRGTIDDPSTPPASPHTRHVVQTTGFIGAQGTYLSGATFWMPQRPAELFTFTLRTVLPEGYASVSQGKRTSHEIAAGVVRSKWHCPFPQQEIFLIAGKYVVTAEPHGDVDIMTFLYTADPQIYEAYIPATKRYLDLYSRLIGPYPYHKFALVENFWQTGLGMPSFTLLGDQVIRLPFIVSTSYGHEILHNWWGNSVYVDGATGNWSEGLTTYGADYLYTEMQSPEAARDYRRGLLHDYLNYVHGDQELPLKDFRAPISPAARAVGYGKGAMVFHMLRQMVGEEAYWAALRQFYRDFRFQVASWGAIFSAFTAVTQRDFKTIKAQWIERVGAPFIALDAVTLQQVRPPYQLEVVITQSPPYDLDVPVQVQTEQGIVRHTVSLSEPVTRRQFVLDDRPLAVYVDPDFDVFRRLHRAEVPPTLGQALGAESVLIVVPSQGNPAMVQAYDQLAAQWAEDQKQTVVKDRPYPPALPKNRTVWIFGTAEIGDRWARMLPQDVAIAPGQWRIAGTTYEPAQHTLVITAAHPDTPDQTVNWLMAASPHLVPAIGRKLRHYGKYSYLVFRADTVVDKGIWPVTSSPMRRVIPRQ